MKTIDIIKHSFLTLFREKKNIFTVLIAIFCSLISLVTITVFVTFNSYVNNNYQKNIGFRTLDVFHNDGSEDINLPINESKVKDINHVIEVFSSKYYSFTSYSDFKNEKHDGIISLVATTPNLTLNIVKGENIKEVSGTAICPNNFYPDSSVDSSLDVSIKKENIIKGETLLGKSFEFTYFTYHSNNDEDYNARPEKSETHKKTFKIVGLYDANATMSNANQCYVSLNDMKEIVDISNPDIITSSYVFVDDLENMNYVSNEIEKLDYSVYVVNHFDSNFLNNFKLICMLISSFSIAIAIIILVLYVQKKMISESRRIGSLRSFGYSLTNVRKHYLLEIFSIIFFTYIMSSVLFLVLYLLLKTILLNSLTVYNIAIIVNSFVFGLAFIGIVLIPYLFSIFIIFHKTKDGIINLLKAEE